MPLDHGVGLVDHELASQNRPGFLSVGPVRFGSHICRNDFRFVSLSHVEILKVNRHGSVAPGGRRDGHESLLVDHDRSGDFACYLDSRSHRSAAHVFGHHEVRTRGEIRLVAFRDVKFGGRSNGRPVDHHAAARSGLGAILQLVHEIQLILIFVHFWVNRSNVTRCVGVGLRPLMKVVFVFAVVQMMNCQILSRVYSSR